MTWTLKAVALASCVAVAACSAGGAGNAKPLAGDSDPASGHADAATGKGPEHPVGVGKPIDVNGDGTTDGVAVDSDGDGVPDGVDTDGDGVIDAPLPGQDAGSTTADAGPPYPIDDAGQVLCGTGPCACSDGIDNDDDGVTDLLDPECVSTWDDDEGSFATGIPGDNRDDACQDCFFDGNSGSGNDGCRLPTSCLTEGNASSGRGSCNKCEQSAECKSFCQAYTPNGCDCFGCCDVSVAGTIKHVLLSSDCNIDGDKLDHCTECVPSTTCVNTCGKCELCPGKTLHDLPAECFPGTGGNDAGTGGGVDAGGPSSPPPYTCDNGETVCGAGLPGCAAGSLCQFGCCVLSPILI